MSNSKNLHILEDNKFFSDMINEIKLRDLEDINTFAVKLYKENKDLIYINHFTPIHSNLFVLDKNYDLEQISKGYNKIIFHALSIHDVNQLAKFNKEGKKIFWRQWTSDSLKFEYFGHVVFNKDLETHPKIIQLNKSKSKGIKFQVLNWYLRKSLQFKTKEKYNKVHKALEKIDLIFNWNYFETDGLKKFYPKLRAEVIMTAYSNNEKIKLSITQAKQPVKVLLGHSGYPDNRHLEIIDFIAKNDLASKIELVCPLVYGINNYIDEVCEYGVKFLNKNFIPIKTFISKEEYIDFLSGFDCLIFNNINPSAAGNIFKAIHLGKKVYLREENPMYQEILNLGLVIYSIQFLNSNPNSIFEPIGQGIAAENNRILSSSPYADRFVKTMDLFLEN